MNVTTIGLDIAKNVFHLVGADAHGKQVLKKRLTRGKVVAYFANLSACLVGIEACGGAQYWARQLIALGHEARLIHPKFVKPYLRGDKNDYNDAGGCHRAGGGGGRCPGVRQWASALSLGGLGAAPAHHRGQAAPAGDYQARRQTPARGAHPRCACGGAPR